ncbi:diaminopimelate epimerase [candidate division GN15 bacterium]|uniref:Diaminopimelate epimerase n=1 Tax=candidate division GN15 bacterium TaxID=2072418 RepID=A0A855XB41_9BACT|nr:MAG: diaminopimelate epimerase [candidate division GN15 bacterium]
MKIQFSKYQALGNDFLVVDRTGIRFSRARLGRLALDMCNRRTGVGADGILLLTKAGTANSKVDVFNADGGWAEKSGNGLRITAAHLRMNGEKSSTFRILMGGEESLVALKKTIPGGYLVTAELGQPDFRSSHVPVKSRNTYLINGAVRIAGKPVTATCLSIGNPHTVIFVDDFDFDWHALGRALEHAPIFPRATNVEFVKVMSRSKLRVNDWERGAGATGSSGTGAAAAVCAAVMLGKAERECEVRFDTGSLFIHWRASDDVIELTGPVQCVMSGMYEWR